MFLTSDFGRRLVLSSTIPASELRRAVYQAVSRHKPFPRALADASATARDLLSRPLDDADHPAVHAVTPVPELVDRLPRGLIARLYAVPVGTDPGTGTVDLAVVDPLDPHPAAEVSFQLGASVRAVAASLPELERALDLLRARDESPNPVGTPLQSEPIALVRRSRSSLAPPMPASAPSLAAFPPDSADATSPAPHSGPKSGGVEMVVDFSAASRESSGLPAEPPTRVPVAAKAPPFPSITPILEEIDTIQGRDPLLDAMLRGLCTTAACAAIFAPRKGNYGGLAASGALDRNRVRGATIAVSSPAFAEAIARGERIGTLDPHEDAALAEALDLERLGHAEVLIHPASVSGRLALVLVSFGFTDPGESSRRARALANAASTALTRMLRRPTPT